MRRCSLLSSTAAHRNLKENWARGEADRGRHASTAPVCPTGIARTGGLGIPQVHFSHPFLSLSNRIQRCLLQALTDVFSLQYFAVEPYESTRQRDSDSEDEQPKAKISSPSPSSQRVAVFPGLSPAALIVSIQNLQFREFAFMHNEHDEHNVEPVKICLPFHMSKAQIKKKTGGRGREEPEEDVRREASGGHNEEAAAAPSPSQLSSSPRSTAHLAGAARVLPPIGGSDAG